MEKKVQFSMLLDIYGKLLTDKQKNIMDLYYNFDLSLSEIAEHTNTSRQAVYDIIRRCNRLLVQYERKLTLMDRKLKLKKSINDILKMLNSIENTENKAKIDDIKKYIMDNI
ncbi:putative DNA-binding protein [Clostridium sp. LBM24168]